MSVREVTKDTILAGQYALEKGAMVHMPTRVIHADLTLRDADITKFRPHRFLRAENQGIQGGTAPKDIRFRAFGEGKTLCPGRQFATNEVIAVVTLFVSRFDMQPASNQDLKLPTSYNTSFATAVMVPDKDIEVKIKRRPC